MTEDGYEVSAQIQVRFKDLDAMGHVNNAVYLTYLEMARVQYFRELLGDLKACSFEFIMARVEIDFLAPVQMEDALVCRIGVTSFGRSTFEFSYLLESQESGQAVARAKSLQVMYDYSAGQSRKLDSDTKGRMAALRTQRGLPEPPTKEAGPKQFKT